jgi:hypothetical protein
MAGAGGCGWTRDRQGVVAGKAICFGTLGCAVLAGESGAYASEGISRVAATAACSYTTGEQTWAQICLFEAYVGVLIHREEGHAW